VVHLLLENCIVSCKEKKVFLMEKLENESKNIVMLLWESLLCLYLEEWFQFYSFYLKTKTNKQKPQKNNKQQNKNNWTKTKRAVDDRCCVDNDATACNNLATNSV